MRFLPVILVALVVVPLGVFAGMRLFNESPPPLTAEALTEAVADEVGTASAGECSKRGPDRWRCSQWDPGMSGDGRDYTVMKTRPGCWSGRIIGKPMTTEGPMPVHVKGCL